MTAHDADGRARRGQETTSHRGWRPGEHLTSLEQDMVRMAESGELLDLGGGRAKQAGMRTWGHSRTIRAAVLRHLLVDNEWRVHAKGVRLRGVRITGRLDLEGTVLRCSLHLESCYLGYRGPVILDYATCSRLTVADCHLSGLSGDTLVVTQDLDLRGSTFAGPLVLPDAAITGVLNGNDATIKGTDRAGNALLADGLDSGDVILDGLTAAGTVSLNGATIAGRFSCSGAKLEVPAQDEAGAPGYGWSLAGMLMKVGGGAYLNAGFIAAGTVWLESADFTGGLDCSGAKLTCAGGGHDSLFANRVHVKGDLNLENSSATGAVQLLFADITGSVRCAGARLTGADRDGNSLFADRMKVSGSVYLNQKFTASGGVSLLGADITGQLNFRGAQLTGANHSGYALLADLMKVGGAVLLGEGFTAAGTVRLSEADITGPFDCSGGTTLTGTGDDGALCGDQMKVGSDVSLSGEFTATGAIRLKGADIAGSLYCSGAVLTGRDREGRALHADGLKVGSNAFLDSGFTAAGAVRLLRASIAGELSCAGGAQVTRPADGNALIADQITAGSLRLDGLTAAGAVRLVDADITGQISCSGTRLTGADDSGNALFGDRLKSGSVFLNDKFMACGAVRLVGADISGQLNCHGAHMYGADADGNALAGDGMTVGGDVIFDGGLAAGTVRLPGANITGQLSFSGAMLTGAGGNALMADQVTVGADTYLDHVVTAGGVIRLVGARIQGSLTCSAARLTGAGGTSLLAEGLKVGSSVFFDDGFETDSMLSLVSAQVDGSVRIEAATLARRGGTTALDATGTQITHELRWAPAGQVTGRVILDNASVGQLEDTWGGGRENGYWPQAGRGLLSLEGFTYTRIGDQADLDERLTWIGSQPEGPLRKRIVPALRRPWRVRADRRSRRRARAVHGFAPQPYEQLATAYQQAGQDTEARTVAIARRRDLRLYAKPKLNLYRRALNWLLEKTIQYGYQTWRAVLGIAVLYVIVLGFFWYAQHRTGLIVPAQSTQGLHPQPTAGSCVQDYPCFSPAGYAVDTVIPLINVHQADYWRPNASAHLGWLFVYVSWAGIILGWTLATLAVAGYTGLVRNSDSL
jgi:uncharacterized protein YjbI with pentapeptide repeats